jgi:CO/xanthine dehydrogenase Mo-binding subunit
MRNRSVLAKVRRGPAVAAIVNAFGNATGKRIRELPRTRDRVKAALG